MKKVKAVFFTSSGRKIIIALAITQALVLHRAQYNNLSYQNDWLAGLDRKSRILSEKQFGEVRVQKRAANL